MRTLSDHIGRVALHENIRQQHAWDRATLRLLRDGEARAAYREYERYDRIHDAHSVTERRIQVIEDHARLEAGGLDTIILAPRRRRHLFRSVSRRWSPRSPPRREEPPCRRSDAHRVAQLHRLATAG